MSSIGALLMVSLTAVALEAEPSSEESSLLPKSYAAAYYEAQQSRRPLVVVVGAKWCPACQRLKKEGLPHLKQAGIFKKALLTIVDYDEQPQLAEQLTKSGPLPQVFVFHPTQTGLQGRKMVGYPSSQALLKFVTSALNVNESAEAPSQTDMNENIGERTPRPASPSNQQAALAR